MSRTDDQLARMTAISKRLWELEGDWAYWDAPQRIAALEESARLCDEASRLNAADASLAPRVTGLRDDDPADWPLIARTYRAVAAAERAGAAGVARGACERGALEKAAGPLLNEIANPSTPDRRRSDLYGEVSGLLSELVEA